MYDKKEKLYYNGKTKQYGILTVKKVSVFLIIFYILAISFKLELRAEEKSYNEIANYLNEHEIETRFTRSDKQFHWHPSTVRNILMRPEVILNKKEEET